MLKFLALYLAFAFVLFGCFPATEPATEDASTPPDASTPCGGLSCDPLTPPPDDAATPDAGLVRDPIPCGGEGQIPCPVATS